MNIAWRQAEITLQCLDGAVLPLLRAGERAGRCLGHSGHGILMDEDGCACPVLPVCHRASVQHPLERFLCCRCYTATVLRVCECSKHSVLWYHV